MDPAERAFDFANAVLATQTAILLGLINAKVVTPEVMRQFLEGLIENLSPDERKEAYGVCLHSVLSGIEALTAVRPAPSKLN